MRGISTVLLALLLVVIASLILGMCLPVTAAYIVVLQEIGPIFNAQPKSGL